MNSVFPHPAIKAMRFLGGFMLSSITVLPWILISFDYQNHGDEVFPAQNDGEPTLATLATLATNQPTNTDTMLNKGSLIQLSNPAAKPSS